VLVLTALPGFHLDQLPSLIANANPWLLLTAFVIYYLGFPLRGYRWALLLRGAGTEISVRDSTEIVFLSWLVNCLVPAKLGDVYRAYLLKLNKGTSISKTFGTIFIERVFRSFRDSPARPCAGFWELPCRHVAGGPDRLRDRSPRRHRARRGLFLVRNFGGRIVRRLPLPARVVEFYDRFEEGLFSINARRVPLLAFLTVLIWSTEALRLYFVVLAMGFNLPLGLSGGLFCRPDCLASDSYPVHARGPGCRRGRGGLHPDHASTARPRPRPWRSPSSTAPSA